ncbi:MAG: 4-hydroxyphenylpyruvate dioxygenase [Polyangiales bacterium]
MSAMAEAAPVAIDNPMGTDGFEFVEYTAEDPQRLSALFTSMGFAPVARHRSKDVVLYRQGEINFLVNAEPGSFSREFAAAHGPSICAIALRVKDARKAYERALALGARPHHGPIGPMELAIPAIKGIGDSAIYLVDRYGARTIYDVDFVPLSSAPEQMGVGLRYIDHLTHNVERGRMDAWADFYQRLFGFRELRYFDIKGKHTGLHSRALCSPCGKIRIPINESADDKSQIEEYLRAYRGEGIQHLALACDDIYSAVEALRARGVKLLDTPDSYYDLVEQRLPGHGEDLPRLRSGRILIDGSTAGGQRKLLLQIFTEAVIGPIFFELIERKGDEGFGQGNFQALFEAMELDQVKRGAL